MDYQKILLSFLIVFNLLCLHYSLRAHISVYGFLGIDMPTAATRTTGSSNSNSNSVIQRLFGAAQDTVEDVAQNVQNANPTNFTKSDINAGCQLRTNDFTTEQKEEVCSTYLEYQKEFYEKEFAAEKEKLENEGWFSSFKLSNADNNDAAVDEEDS